MSCFAVPDSVTPEEPKPPLKVSWSRVLDFEKCRQRSFLTRKGVRSKVVDGRNFLPGTLADRCVRIWLQQDEPHAPKQMHAILDNIWEEYTSNSDEYKIKWRANPSQDKKFVRDTVIEACDTVEPFLFKAVLPYEYEPDAAFKVPLTIPDIDGNPREILLNGFIDIAVRRTGEPRPWWLYDLKVTRDNSYATGSTLGQLIFYPWAWSIRHGVPVDEIGAAFIVPLAKSQYVPIAPSEEDVRVLKTRVIAYAHSVWRDEPKDRALTDDLGQCYNCPTRSACPRFAPPTIETTTGGRRVSFSDAVNSRKDNRG